MGKRVAMIVPNPCSPDFRVMKQAETLAKAGYEVRVYCTWKRGLGVPKIETINGVEYYRKEWNVMHILRQIFFNMPPYPEVSVVKKRFKE